MALAVLSEVEPWLLTRGGIFGFNFCIRLNISLRLGEAVFGGLLVAAAVNAAAAAMLRTAAAASPR